MDPSGRFRQRIFQPAFGEPVLYHVFVPHARQLGPSATIVFLHGIGECGSDGEKPIHVGLGAAIETSADTFDRVAVFPQSTWKTWRASSSDAQIAFAILDSEIRDLELDPKRITLTGIGMGGYGVWSLAMKYPNLWRAIVPICGGGNTTKADRIARIPCWCFHGESDDVVPVDESRDMIAALKSAGGTPRYTEYAGTGHNVWDRAYRTPELYEWIDQQESISQTSAPPSKSLKESQA